MVWWKCNKCGYTFQEVTAPSVCPSCKEKCTFKDITCYIPECGLGDEEEHIDHRL